MTIPHLHGLFAGRFADLPGVPGALLFQDAPVPLPKADRGLMVETLGGVVVRVAIYWGAWRPPVRLLLGKYGRPMIRSAGDGEPIFSVRIMKKDYLAVWPFRDGFVSLGHNGLSWDTTYVASDLIDEIRAHSY
ncbi:MAG: hypothetical protein AB7K71_36005 [Polyangiaceae bacterium]